MTELTTYWAKLQMLPACLRVYMTQYYLPPIADSIPSGMLANRIRGRSMDAATYHYGGERCWEILILPQGLS